MFEDIFQDSLCSFHVTKVRENTPHLPVAHSIRFHGERGENSVVVSADLDANAFIHIYCYFFRGYLFITGEKGVRH